MNIVIAKLIFAACVGGLFAFFIKGVFSLQEGLECSETNQSKFDKQQFVKDNIDAFGIKDKGCGDIKEIYTVSPQTMGF